MRTIVFTEVGERNEGRKKKEMIIDNISAYLEYMAEEIFLSSETTNVQQFQHAGSCSA